MDVYCTALIPSLWTWPIVIITKLQNGFVYQVGFYFKRVTEFIVVLAFVRIWHVSYNGQQAMLSVIGQSAGFKGQNLNMM